MCNSSSSNAKDRASNWQICAHERGGGCIYSTELYLDFKGVYAPKSEFSSHLFSLMRPKPPLYHAKQKVDTTLFRTNVNTLALGEERTEIEFLHAYDMQFSRAFDTQFICM